MSSELVLTSVLSRGSRSRFVRIAQEWLCLHGFQTMIDGRFGPATEKVIRDFQNHSQLTEDGLLTPATYDALVQPMKRAIRSISSDGASFSEMIVRHARQHLSEHPREIGGQNCGPWVRLYMNGKEGTVDRVPQAWCAGFISFLVRAASRDSRTAIPITLSASCTTFARNAQSAGLLHSTESLQTIYQSLRSGSLFFQRKGVRSWQHIGVITHADKETMHTIEGNTNDNGDREGYEVCARTRDYRGKDFVMWRQPVV